MSNRELYKRSFDKLHPSEKFQKELNDIMDTNRTKRTIKLRKILALAAAAAVMLSLGIVASATGMFQTVRVWIDGTEVDAEGYMEYTENEDFVIKIDGEEHEEVEVFYSMGGEASDNGENILISPIDAIYENREGRDYLCITNDETDETQEIDITDEMIDGVYQDTITALGWVCEVDLSVDGENVSMEFEVISAEWK